MKNKVYFSALVSLFAAVMLFSCASQQFTVQKEPEISDEGFPSFITPVESYFVTRIGDVPRIKEDTYVLRVEGLVDRPRSYTLDELYAMDMVELPLTVECIGNSPSGPLVSTAVWEGFLLYDFLQSLGVSDRATGVRYEAADGYYASHTMEQIRDNGVLVALHMNGEPIPPLHGFPVRVLNPGYYGVKQPAWVTRIEVIDRPLEDYWDDRGWDVSPPIAVDSLVFTPKKPPRLKAGETLRITGAAFGGGRIEKVELTRDGGKTWFSANIVEQVDADNIWVFWEANLTFEEQGKYVVNVRATDTEGNSQREDDPNRYDGSNDWPMIRVTVR